MIINKYFYNKPTSFGPDSELAYCTNCSNNLSDLCDSSLNV